MTTHATLKADVASYLARSDLTDSIPTFVRLAESTIRTDVRVRAMESSTTLTLDAQTVALPSGFLSARRIYLDSTNNRQLDLMAPDAFWDDPRSELGGTPEVYTIEGDNILFAPYPATTMYAKMLYFAAFTALSGDADTNWLLTNHYDVYLYGCLSQAKAFIEDDEQAGKWASAYEQSVRKVNEESWKGRHSGSPMRRGGCPV